MARYFIAVADRTGERPPEVMPWRSWGVIGYGSLRRAVRMVKKVTGGLRDPNKRFHYIIIETQGLGQGYIDPWSQDYIEPHQPHW